MFQPDQDGIYARVGIAPARRALALVVLYGLAVVLLYLAFRGQSGPFGALFVLVIAAACFWTGEQMRRYKDIELLLTDDQLISSDGFVLAKVSDISAVNRGALAAKPSTGFTLVLKTRQPRSWRPGLWWRLGRRVGIGGITGAGAAKFMAEQIDLRIKKN